MIGMYCLVYRVYPAAGTNQIVIGGWGSGAYGAALWSPQLMNFYSSARSVLFIDSAVDVDMTSYPANNTLTPYDTVVQSSIQSWNVKTYRGWGLSSSAALTGSVALVPTLTAPTTSNNWTMDIDDIIGDVASQYSSRLIVARFLPTFDSSLVSIHFFRCLSCA
jgi:hypothetical protein